MEIKKTKFVPKDELNKSKSKSYKRANVINLRQEMFKQVMKLGNTRIIIHSELCRLTSEEKRQWFKEELERGNPVLLRIQEAILDCYR